MQTTNEMAIRPQEQAMDGFDLKQAAKEYRLLTREEMTELGIRAGNGDQEAANKLIRHNISLVYWVAAQYDWMETPLEDRVQEGMLGLMRATRDYDPSKGTFATYATIWIRQRIRRANSAYENVIARPSHIYDDEKMIRRMIDEYEAAYKRMPSIKEIGKVCKMTEDKVLAIIQTDTRRMISLDTPIGEKEDSVLADIVEGETECPETHCEHKIMQETVKEHLKKLSERERNIIERRFGIVTGIEETLSEIGKTYNISGERVRQIMVRAFAKLEPQMRREQMQQFL